MSDFSKIIFECSEAIKLGKTYLSQGNVPAEQIGGLKNLILFSFLRKTIAHYSSGASKETVTQSLIETVTAFEEGFKWEGFEKSYGMYDQIIWMLSLGILCGISDNDFKRIVDILKRDKATDRLIKTLVNYRLPNEMQGYLYIQISPYADIDMLVTGADKSTTFIKNYLDKKWYQGHSDAPWYNSHKRTKVNTYFGYWAWEVGALVKIKGIDDSSLKNQNYYPYDAVHW